MRSLTGHSVGFDSRLEFFWDCLKRYLQDMDALRGLGEMIRSSAILSMWEEASQRTESRLGQSVIAASREWKALLSCLARIYTPLSSAIAIHLSLLTSPPPTTKPPPRLQGWTLNYSSLRPSPPESLPSSSPATKTPHTDTSHTHVSHPHIGTACNSYRSGTC